MDRIAGKFKSISGVDIEFDGSIKKLIYSEGVYPSQGVRPVLSSIGNIISPKLSDVFRSLEPEHEKVRLFTKTKNFSTESIPLEATLVYGSRSTKEPVSLKFDVPLELGKLRMTSRCDKAPLMAVHEASHAVLYSLLTGECPESIVALSTNGGGYMKTKFNISDDIGSSSIEELDADIIVSLAGYYGEREFFEETKCSLGSGADIQSSWDALSKAFHN